VDGAAADDPEIARGAGVGLPTVSCRGRAKSEDPLRAICGKKDVLRSLLDEP
jgi:hypothetical protein